MENRARRRFCEKFYMCSRFGAHKIPIRRKIISVLLGLARGVPPVRHNIVGAWKNDKKDIFNRAPKRFWCRIYQGVMGSREPSVICLVFFCV